MVLTGTFARSVDEKLRLAIPKGFRDALAGATGSGLYIAPGTDGSLALYGEDAFSKLAERLARASPTGQDVRAFGRLFYARAARLDLDAQGRVRLPVELAKYASISREAVLIGAGDHLELWDRTRWDEYLSAQADRYDTIAEAAFRTSSVGPQES